MRIFQDETLRLESSVLTIGAFDGLHIGHQKLIKSVKARSDKLCVPSVVYTFDPPPKVYFGKANALMTLEEKIDSIEKYEIDYLVVANFNSEFSSMDKICFKKELKNLNPKELLIGADFKFGKDRSGTIDYLKKYFNVFSCPLITCPKGKVISSTRIRSLKSENKIEEISHML